jgi:hypothetical protein
VILRAAVRTEEVPPRTKEDAMQRKRVREMAVVLLIAALTSSLAVADDDEEYGGPQELAVAWNDWESGGGVVRPLMLRPPFEFTAPAVATGANAVLRSADGRVYAVSRTHGTITVIDADSWVVTDIFGGEAWGELEDIAVVRGGVAYVTRSGASALLRLDLTSGSVAEVLDLSFLADEDGIPDMGMMAVQSGRLFIQIRRISESGHFVAPAYLAVMDLATEQLADADPEAPGVQAIALKGTFPKMKMQRTRRNDRLYVSATGHAFDNGGIEAIDTVHLRSLGLVLAEADGFVGVDLGPFVFTGPGGGFLVYTTDITVSSHFHPFTVAGEVGEPSPIANRVEYLAPVLAFHQPSDLVFFPDGPAPRAGVLVLDGRSGDEVLKGPVRTQSTPNDFALVVGRGRFGHE